MDGTVIYDKLLNYFEVFTKQVVGLSFIRFEIFFSESIDSAISMFDC